jgi:hypothetical protein
MLPFPSGAPSTSSPTSTHGEVEEGNLNAEGGLTGGGGGFHYHDDATFMSSSAMQHQHHHHQQPRRGPLPPLDTLYGEVDYDYEGSPAALNSDLLRLVGVLEAENALLETLALGRLQGDQAVAAAEEVASTIQDLRDARALLEAYETERGRLAGACDRLLAREAALARWAGLSPDGVEALVPRAEQEEGGAGEAGAASRSVTPPPTLRRALAAARRERDGLGERMAELGKEAHAAEARAVAAEASATGRAAALEAQARALEKRMEERVAVGTVDVAVAAARGQWEREVEALVSQLLLQREDWEDEKGATVAAAAAAAANEEEEEEGQEEGQEEEFAVPSTAADWRARLTALAAQQRRDERRQRRRLLSTFQKLVEEREARARVEREIGVVKARLEGVEEAFRRRQGRGDDRSAALVEEAERQRDAARVELAAARAAADSARTRVGSL